MWREFLEAVGIRTLDYIDDGCRHTWVIAYGKEPLQWLFWALFGNDDNGQDDLNSEGEYRGFMRWWLRNPLHNLCAYVLGFKGGKLEYSTGGRYPSFVDGLTVDWLKCSDHPTSILPKNQWFPFLHGPWFYWGWRSDGTFGVKVKLWRAMQDVLQNLRSFLSKK